MAYQCSIVWKGMAVRHLHTIEVVLDVHVKPQAFQDELYTDNLVCVVLPANDLGANGVTDELRITFHHGDGRDYEGRLAYVLKKVNELEDKIAKAKEQNRLLGITGDAG